MFNSEGSIERVLTFYIKLNLRVYYLINVDNILRVYQSNEVGQIEPNFADIGILCLMNE